jgi:hypothetical protein
MKDDPPRSIANRAGHRDNLHRPIYRLKEHIPEAGIEEDGRQLGRSEPKAAEEPRRLRPQKQAHGKELNLPFNFNSGATDPEKISKIVKAASALEEVNRDLCRQRAKLRELVVVLAR